MALALNRSDWALTKVSIRDLHNTVAISSIALIPPFVEASFKNTKQVSDFISTYDKLFCIVNYKRILYLRLGSLYQHVNEKETLCVAVRILPRLACAASTSPNPRLNIYSVSS